MIKANQQKKSERTSPRAAFRWILAIFFILVGINHFRMRAIYIAMMPPWVPWPAGLNAIAGVCKILGGIGILVPRLRIAAGWGLIGLLVAVFPANLHVALVAKMPGYGFSPTFLWLRLPFQAVLVAWVSWVAIAKERGPGS